MNRQEGLGNVGSAEEDVQLGAEAHHPQDRKCPQCHLVRRAPCEQRDSTGRQGDGDLVVDDGSGREAKSPPAGCLRRAGLAPRSDDGTGQEGEFDNQYNLDAGNYRILGYVANWVTGNQEQVNTVDYQLDITPIPEPATVTMLGLGGLAMARRRRRSK